MGHKRLESMLGCCLSQDPHGILQLILDEVSAHAAGAPQADDITLVIIRVVDPQGGMEDTITRIDPLCT